MKTIGAGTVRERLPYTALEVPDWRSLNKRLRAALLQMAASMEDKGSHMPNGRSFFEEKWLSPNRLHLEADPAFQDLSFAIETAANSAVARPKDSARVSITSMWSIISRAGMEGRRHNHKGTLSAAYYVDAGNSSSDCGGQLLFYADPIKQTPTHTVEPRSGLLVLFPSSLHHSVSRYVSDYPRIVVSANLR